MDLDLIRKYMSPGARFHLVGIGGISMSALAEIMISMGISVSGSDISDSTSLMRLKSLGAKIYLGHSAAHITGVDAVIRTKAVHDENPEISAAKMAGIPVFERSAAWGVIMSSYSDSLCVSGTHGKTTTTSMAACIAISGGADPSVMVGGVLPAIGGTLRIGSTGLFIAEACEYCNSFLNFSPTVAVILNIDLDHTDFFSTLENMIESFRSFAALVPENKAVVVNSDDKNAMWAVRGLKRNILTFGLSETADVTAKNLVSDSGFYAFDIYVKGSLYTYAKLSVPGIHNVQNALAAAAAAYVLGFKAEAVSAGLSMFKGTGRRFEIKGTIKGALLVDDYAHHPSEIKATIKAAREFGAKRVICVFQPHTYSRTKSLFNELKSELSKADLLVLADIFAAREHNTLGVSSKDLADSIPGALYIKDFNEISDFIRFTARDGDIIITMGAGDIYKAGNMALSAGFM